MLQCDVAPREPDGKPGVTGNQPAIEHGAWQRGIELLDLRISSVIKSSGTLLSTGTAVIRRG